MEILVMVLIGLAAGFGFRYLNPNRNSATLSMTTAVGIAGALAGGYFARHMGIYEVGPVGFFFGALLGAGLFLFLLQIVVGHKKAV